VGINAVAAAWRGVAILLLGEGRMTQEDIIWKPEKIVELCKQAGFADGVAECMGLWSLHEFARIVAAAEREACAKACEEVGVWPSLGPKHCAEAIRARGQA